MPAGRGKQCERCYWTQLAEKRAATSSEVFQLPEHISLFVAFGRWLIEKVGAHKAAITLNKYLPFFVEIAALGSSIPPYETLLTHFSAGGLRKNLLPMRFLEETGRALPDEEAKQNASEQRRIQEILLRLPVESPLRPLIDRYYSVLMGKHAQQRTSLKSVRLALTPAVAFLSVAMKAGHDAPSQADLSTYLIEAPGQRAALTGFVNMLCLHFQVELKLEKTGSRLTAFAKRRALERAIADLLQSDLSLEVERAKLVAASLQYFHDLPLRSAIRAAKDGALVRGEDGNVAFLHDGTRYRLPQDISARLS